MSPRAQESLGRARNRLTAAHRLTADSPEVAVSVACCAARAALSEIGVAAPAVWNRCAE